MLHCIFLRSLIYLTIPEQRKALERREGDRETDETEAQKAEEAELIKEARAARAARESSKQR